MNGENSIHQFISRWGHYLLAAIVAVTRIPFLFDGYGHEEDSWGLVVNAWEMHTSGHYVASRFPGHPFQEYIYAVLWNQPAWLWNLLSCVFSIVAVNAFYEALKKSGFSFAFPAALMLAFSPAFYISGTYTIDYAWSLAFIMLSFLALVRGHLIWCGVLLGMAVGCRITSGVFIIPWAILLFNRMDLRKTLTDLVKTGLPLALIGIAWYIPAYLNYGTSFFDYSDQFPYPPFTKIAYKASIGVFGLCGMIALAVVLFSWLFRKNKSAQHAPANTTPTRMTLAIFAILVLHIISYLRLPQKSGYLVSLIPFVILLAGMYSTQRTFRIAAVLFVLAPFLFSINLTDSLRGSESTPLAVRFHVSGQEIFLDPLSGPIFSEQSKRRNKMAYVEKVCAHIDTTSDHEFIICGWWYNEILTAYLPGRSDKTLPANITLKFYVTCQEIKAASPTHNIYFLPEQNLYNDQVFGQSCTDSLATPFPVQ
jgi:hypothetical protein